MDYIELEDLEVGQAYKCEGRNLEIAIWDGNAFHGVRHKHGDCFITNELHWDTDPKYGTVKPLYKLV